MSLYLSNGQPLSAKIDGVPGSVVDMDVAPGATRICRLTSETLKVGFVQLQSSGRTSVAATVVVRWSQNNQVSTELGITQQFPFCHYSFPAEVDSALRVNTGLALAVPSNAAAPVGVVITLIREDGTIQGTNVVRLNPRRQLARFLNEDPLFAGLEAFRGSVSISSTEPIGVVALRMDDAVVGSMTVSEGPVIAPHVSASPVQPEVEPNESTSLASHVVPGLINAAFKAPGDVDFYGFAGRRGDIVTALTDTSESGSQVDTIVSLLRSDGLTVCRNDQNGLPGASDSFVRASLPSDGQYYLKIEEAKGNGGTTSSYKLHLCRSTSSGDSTLPAIASISPGTAGRGSTVNVVIKGAELSDGQLVFSSPDGITVSNVVAGPGQATATVAVSSSAATGSHQVLVRTPKGDSNALSFEVNLIPKVTEVHPRALDCSNRYFVTLKGSNLDDSTSTIEITPAAGMQVSETTCSASTCTAIIAVDSGAAPGYRSVRIRNSAGTSNDLVLQVLVPPGAGPPVIVGLLVQPPTFSSGSANLPLLFGVRRLGGIKYVPNDFERSAKMVFRHGSCVAMFVSPNFTIPDGPPYYDEYWFGVSIVMDHWLSNVWVDFEIIDAGGRISDPKSFQAPLWMCELRLRDLVRRTDPQAPLDRFTASLGSESPVRSSESDMRSRIWMVGEVAENRRNGGKMQRNGPVHRVEI